MTTPADQPPEGPPPEAWQPPSQMPPPPLEPGPSRELVVPDPAGPPSPPYPVQAEISYPAELNRWLPLVKWLLVIPHFIVLYFVGIAALFVAVFGWFAVLFTGRWPRGAFDFLVGTFRWAMRVGAYSLLMTDAYPPFSLADDPNYPVRLHVEYPEHIANWRPLVQWLLAIPYVFVAAILYWFTWLLAFVAFFTILFTKKIPRDVFDLMVPGIRWNMRGSVYTYWMTERYPPFIWG